MRATGHGSPQEQKRGASRTACRHEDNARFSRRGLRFHNREDMCVLFALSKYKRNMVVEEAIVCGNHIDERQNKDKGACGA